MALIEADSTYEFRILYLELAMSHASSYCSRILIARPARAVLLVDSCAFAYALALRRTAAFQVTIPCMNLCGIARGNPAFVLFGSL